MKRERQARIEHEIQREMARILTTEFKDPRMGFVTVTRAEITQDLMFAKVFVSIIGDRHVARLSMDALENGRGFLRGELGRSISLRHVPELTFVEDRSTERAIALSRTLDRVRAAEEAAQSPAAVTPGDDLAAPDHVLAGAAAEGDHDPD